MMILVNSVHGEPIFINPIHIIRIMEGEGGAWIRMTDDMSHHVKETPAIICSLIRNAKANG